MRKPKKLNAHELHRAAITEAMPEVKRLVARFGRTVISGCLKRITELEKERSRLAELKAEVAALEKRV